MKNNNERYYYHDGPLMEETSHINAAGVHWYRTYYPDGDLRSEAHYLNGRAHGTHREFLNSDHSVSLEELYIHHGEHHGRTVEYSESGAVALEIYYLYDDQVTWEKYRRHEIVTKLGGLMEM